MTPWLIIRRCILKHEGGYSDHAADAGGETRWGISKKSYPNMDIAALTIEEAIKIAKRDYWDVLRLDEVADPRIQSKIFDMAFNMGTGRVARIVQVAVGVTVDGIVGDKTLKAVNRMPTSKLINELVDRHMGRYVDIVIGNPSQVVFLKGWSRRALDRMEDVV